MKIVISCASKFHADHVAYQMQTRNLLDKIITAYPSFAYKRVPLKRDKVLFLPPIFMFAVLLEKSLGKYNIFKSSLEWLLVVIYDWLVSFLIGNPDVSLSWAWVSLRTIRTVQKRGGIAILEESASCKKHQNELLNEEYKNLSLEYTTGTPLSIVEREFRECNEADYILCPSKYVAESFRKYQIPQEKLIIIPYGVEPQLFYRVDKADDVFRILFVGSVGVRKGIIYLFQALKMLNINNYECLVIGQVEPAFQKIFDEFHGYFRHIPKVEHTKLKEYYSNASVFVFPSLDEGMACVQLEAMSCGLPVICTHNSGGDSIVCDGEEGFVIPIRDPHAIQEKLEYLYHHPDELTRMSHNALNRAKEFTWDRYGQRLEDTLYSLLARNNEKQADLSG